MSFDSQDSDEDWNPGSWFKYSKIKIGWDESCYEMIVVNNDYKRKIITGFVFCNVLDEKNSLDKYGRIANQVPLRKEWVLHSVYNPHYKTIEDTQLPETSGFVKIEYDRAVEYGDGGYSLLIYPLYWNKKLTLAQKYKNMLRTKLDELSLLRNDWHDDCPVLDIIDPDLGPNYYFQYSNAKNSAEINALPERQKYAWYPVDVIVKSDDSIQFLGPIHKLPIAENKILYECFSEVFKQMLPGFRKLNITEEGKDCKVQVVFKAQKYVINPNVAYSGKWHVEGRTENIVAGGVYYCKIDEGFDQDVLVYRPKVGPTPSFAECCNTVMDAEIHVKEDTAIVFSNTLPHKFLKLENNTNEPLERLFVNFFIVDPSKPIESTTFYWEIEKALKKLKKFPNVIIEFILSFIVYRSNIFEDKEKRRLARQCLKEEKSGWGYICYGNAGEVAFIDHDISKKKLKKFDRIKPDI